MSEKVSGYQFAVFLKDGVIQAGFGHMGNDGKWNKGFLLKTFGEAQGVNAVPEELRESRKEEARAFGAYVAGLTKIKLYVDFGHL